MRQDTPRVTSPTWDGQIIGVVTSPCIFNTIHLVYSQGLLPCTPRVAQHNKFRTEWSHLEESSQFATMLPCRTGYLPFLSILFNTMFHAPMGRFHLEVIYYLTYFSTAVPSNSCFFPVGLSPLIHFQQVLWVLKSLLTWAVVMTTCPSQETEETSTYTRPVENDEQPTWK